AILPRLDHRRTALRLDYHHPWPLRSDPADCFELGERLPHADNAGAAAGRVKDHIRQFPAELLGEFDAHRLLAFDAIGLPQGRAVEPADFTLAFGDALAAIVDQPVDEEHFGALHR